MQQHLSFHVNYTALLTAIKAFHLQRILLQLIQNLWSITCNFNTEKPRKKHYLPSYIVASLSHQSQYKGQVKGT